VDAKKKNDDDAKEEKEGQEKHDTKDSEKSAVGSKIKGTLHKEQTSAIVVQEPFL
jgi:hypothetical protein